MKLETDWTLQTNLKDSTGMQFYVKLFEVSTNRPVLEAKRQQSTHT